MSLQVVSADSHVIEPLDIWSKVLSKSLGDATPRQLPEYLGKKGKFFYTGDFVLAAGETDADQAAQGLREAGFLPEKRVDFQKRAGVSAELLNATFAMAIMLNPDFDAVRRSLEVYNDWLSEFVSYDPSRLIGVAMIQMDDVQWAIKELERLVKKGFKGAIINLEAPVGCPGYFSSIYDPFWARAEEMEIPLTLHILTGRVRDPFYFHTRKEREQSGRAFLGVYGEASGVLLNDFILGGIFDRFPRLSLVSSEFEISWLPHYMWRADNVGEPSFAARLNLEQRKLKPSEYLTQRVWHGVINDPYVASTVPVLGAEHILWGSDFPHIRSVGLNMDEALTGIFRNVSEPDIKKMVYDNVVKLYGLAGRIPS
jgi:predicted TIM-barrel fold metal-dependent hydrolase